MISGCNSLCICEVSGPFNGMHCQAKVYHWIFVSLVAAPASVKGNSVPHLCIVVPAPNLKMDAIIQ